MKILHTSDWHLGRTLHNYPLIEDQAYMIEQIISYSQKESIDALIIAGDLYDKSQPSEEAVRLCNDFLNKIILELKIPTLIIAGNHDSNTRIHFGSRLFEHNGLYIIGKTEKGYETIRLPKHEEVAFHLIPYIEPVEVRLLANDPTLTRHDDAMRYLTDEIKKTCNDEANIVIAHAFVAGGDLSESERRLSTVGTAEQVGADCFKDFTYTALGHLHKPQQFGEGHIRYSGSPLAYSTSEANYEKSFTVITLKDRALEKIECVPIAPKRQVRIVEGPLEELIKHGLLQSEQMREDYIYAKVQSDYVENLVGTLRAVYPNILGAEFVSVSQKGSLKDVVGQSDFEAKKKKSMVELFGDFLEVVSGEQFDDEEKHYIGSIIREIEEGNNAT